MATVEMLSNALRVTMWMSGLAQNSLPGLRSGARHFEKACSACHV
jgi:hypothetical protein